MKQLSTKPADVTFVPMLTVERDIDALAKSGRFKIFQDEDDLGPIKCAYLETSKGNVFVVFAYVYRSVPKAMTDIAIPSGLKTTADVLRDITRELGLKETEVTPRDVRYDEVA